MLGSVNPMPDRQRRSQIMTRKLIVLLAITTPLMTLAQDSIPPRGAQDLYAAAPVAVSTGPAAPAAGCGQSGAERPPSPGAGRPRADLPYGAGFEARQRGFGPGGRGFGRRR